MENRKKRRITRKAILVLSGIIIALTVLITGTVMLIGSSESLEDSIETLPFKEDASFVTTANTIVYLDEDYIRSLNENLTVQWALRLGSANLDLVCRNNKISAYGDGLVYVLDSAGRQFFSTRVDGNIISARLCDNKAAIFVQQKVAEDTQSYIISFDMKGSVLYQLDVSDRYILDYGFDYDSDLLYVLELDTSGVAPISRISTYRPETQSMTSVKELKDQLTERIYIIDGTSYALGTSELIKYVTLGENEKETVTYGWMLEDFFLEGQNDPKFLYVPSNSDETGIDIVRIIRSNGSETTINLPPKVFKVLYIEDRVYCFTQSKIYSYTTNGKFLRSFDLPYAIDGARRAFGNKVYLTAEDTVYLMPLP